MSRSTWTWQLTAVLAVAGLSGCAAVTNPTADGIPVRRLPEEIFPPPRESLKDIPLSLLRQPPVKVYKLAPGDVLGVVIENVLGDRGTPPPVRLGGELAGQEPAIGYPIPVQADGTIALPFVEPIKVEGLTLAEAQEAIRKAYTVERQILQPGTERIIVTLVQPRRYHVLVVRQDGGYGGFGSANESGLIKRGTGYSIDLEAYENDVLNALARTGGLPGLDAYNEVLVERASVKLNPDGTMPPNAVVRIPLRLRPGEPLPFRPEDVVLGDGDIIYIQARETEVFYTGGLLPPGEFVLPRDNDLDVVEAVARVRGPLLNGGFNPSSQFLNSQISSGLGSESPSLLTVIRQTPGNRQLTIRVDLNRAFRDPRERILVQPGDFLILQEKPAEAFVRYLTSQFSYNYVYDFITGRFIVNQTTGRLP